MDGKNQTEPNRSNKDEGEAVIYISPVKVHQIVKSGIQVMDKQRPTKPNEGDIPELAIGEVKFKSELVLDDPTNIPLDTDPNALPKIGLRSTRKGIRLKITKSGKTFKSETNNDVIDKLGDPKETERNGSTGKLDPILDDNMPDVGFF